MAIKVPAWSCMDDDEALMHVRVATARGSALCGGGLDMCRDPGMWIRGAAVAGAALVQHGIVIAACRSGLCATASCRT